MHRRVSVAAVALIVASCGWASLSTTTTVTSTPPSMASTSEVASTTSLAPAQPSTTRTVSTTATAPTTSTTADTTPPRLEVTDPRLRATVTESHYRFVGITEPGASVVAAGRYPADVTADGHWSIVLVLNPGGNVATFVATDAGGNSTEVRVPVYLQACLGAPAVAMPAGASEVRTLTADVDGDGEADTVTTYHADGHWRLHVTLAYGWESETDITPYVTIAPPPEPSRVIGLGLPTVVVRLGGNLVGASFGFVALTGCGLTPVLGPDGDMPDIWVGIGIHHSEFFRCALGAVTQVQMGRNETFIGVRETHHPFSTGSVSFGAPTITEEELAAPPIPTDGSDDAAWTDAVARQRQSACLPW